MPAWHAANDANLDPDEFRNDNRHSTDRQAGRDQLAPPSASSPDRTEAVEPS